MSPTLTPQSRWKTMNGIENPVAYSPIPKDTVKMEPISEDEDAGNCELVTHLYLLHSATKEESEIGDGRGEFNSAILVTSCFVSCFFFLLHSTDDLPIG